MSEAKLIPITILTGFLGSGKTTLLNKILKYNNNYKIAIILNEFGDIKLESQLVQKQDEGIVELSNGCICCVARGDMISTLNVIIEKYPDTEYIVLEASGLSDPFALSLTIYNPSLRDQFRLDSIICIVDFLNFERELDEYDITRKQIQDANIIVITKYDGKDERISQLKELLRGLNSKCQILIDSDGFNPIDLLDRSLTDFRNFEELEMEENHQHEHEDFEHYIYQTDKLVDYNKFEIMFNKLSSNIIRAKGFVNFGNAPHKDKKYLLQYVIGRKDYRIEEWNENRSTAVLFIGVKLDKESIEDEFRNCLLD